MGQRGSLAGRESVRCLTGLPGGEASQLQQRSAPQPDVLVWVSQAAVFLKLQECSRTTAGIHSCSSVMLLSSPDCILITFILNGLGFLFSIAKILNVIYFFWQVNASSRTSYLPPIFSCLLILHSLTAFWQ